MLSTAPVAGQRRPARRWPAYVITWFVGAFCVLVMAIWVWDHVVLGNAVGATGWIILGATVLRVVTIAIALSAVQPWGRRVPAPLLTTALWGCAAAQLVYPLAETVVKSLTLAGVLDLPARGIGNMSWVGWFNFSAAWLVFGLPGLLFVLLARDVQRRERVSWLWPCAGIVGGVVVLFAIGAVIG
jgi:hypothetical protein